MSLKECSHGHIFDSDLYEDCPYCQNLAVGISEFAPAFAPYPKGHMNDAFRPADGYVYAGPQYRCDYCSDPIPGGETASICPVGWLVCIEGEKRGNAYPLYEGCNVIGRSPNAEVSIPDPRISRDGTVKIVYEGLENAFYLLVLSARNLVRLNENICLLRGEESLLLHANDVIQIGSHKLLLIPVCTERFTWERGLSQG